MYSDLRPSLLDTVCLLKTPNVYGCSNAQPQILYILSAIEHVEKKSEYLVYSIDRCKTFSKPGEQLKLSKDAFNHITQEEEVFLSKDQ